VPLTEVPLTPNGKIDRAALASMAGTRDSGPPDEPPASERERQLAALWGQVLGRPPANRQDNFFTQGGDSLSATKLLQLIERTVDVQLSLRDFFTTPTVVHLAAAVDAAIAAESAAADLEEGSL
jgi:acyl carrier protein